MDKRTEYVERLTAHMVEWDSQIDLIKSRAIRVMPDAGFACSNAISALQLKWDEVTEKLQEILFATDDEWEGLKIGTEHALGEVRTRFHEAIATIVTCAKTPEKLDSCMRKKPGYTSSASTNDAY